MAEDARRGDSPVVQLDVAIGTMVHGLKAKYYDNPCQFTGKVIEEYKDISGRYLMLRLTGTNLESLLTWATGGHQLAKVHMCTAECNQEAVGPCLLHCQEARTIGGLHEVADLPWRDVLVSAVDRGSDELAGLRGRMEDLPDPVAGGVHPGEVKAADGKGTTKEVDKKKKKKKERRRRRSSGSSEKKRKRRDRSPGSRSRGREKQKVRRKEKVDAGGGESPVKSSTSRSTSEEKNFVMVDQKTMFGRSGLDPSRKVRNRVKRKAQKYAQKKGRSKSDSSSGSEAPQKGESIFGEPHKIGVSFPGVLSAAAIEDMQELMLLEAGQETVQPEGWVPTLLRYYRQMLSRRVSGPMSRELRTLCTVCDQILRGQLPSALDTLIQRVKSLEAQIGGLNWASAHRLELLPSDTATLSTRQELRIATTEHKAESQAHQTSTWWSKGSGKNAHKGEKVDKGKGKGKKGKDKQKKET